MARMSKSKSLKSLKSKAKKGKRGGCGSSSSLMGGSSWSLGTAGMYGGNAPVAMDLVPGLESQSSFAGSSALVTGGEPKVPPPAQQGGRSRRLRSFRKSRKMKSAKVFPNNIFRNMF